MASPTPYTRETTIASAIAAEHASQITGKIILTTGVTQGGLGATFVHEVAKHNPSLLILAGRSASKAQATADALKADPATADVKTRVLVLDLASQSQVRQAAEEVLGYPEDHIDVVVNSAGTMAGPHQTTKDGLENQFGSNHIGHFLFTNLIMPKILAAKRPRVVNVSSDGHRFSGIRFDDPNFQDGAVYDRFDAYGQSKTANILFSKALAEKLGHKGLRAYSLHPGVTFGTSLMPFEWTDKDTAEVMDKGRKVGWSQDLDIKTLDECAGTHVVAAFDPRLDDHNGVYLDNGHVAEPEKTAQNPEDVEKLWKLSEKLVGQSFTY
ncbi:hypothetical protein NX059_003154 [Plenodomus lindquistii]|nr:hypothetical protein NX059_003154 [Plenodomus lindquistii]